ncbi:MAG: branched-chain amino acid transaminase [Bdellovibrionales bacterium]|nr:branched-chain amino acid transaminase [Bdellovibrionales bacterium]
MYAKTKHIWMDGQIVPWENAKVHILTHSLHYGVGIFEGIRFYDCGGEPGIFRLKDHIQRFEESAKIVSIKLPFSKPDLEKACVAMAHDSQLKNGYIRPLLYIGEEPNAGLWAFDNQVHISIIVYGWGAYLGEKGVSEGVRVKTSSYMRHHRNIAMTSAKITGQYFNSVLAKREAVLSGFDEALMLDPEGYVAEGSGENIFAIKNGKIYTPLRASVLRGITRETAMTLLKKEGLDVIETPLTRDDLYVADEVFFTGTAAEITPVREIDHRQIGSKAPGPITRKLQSTYGNLVRGKLSEYESWITPVKK